MGRTTRKRRTPLATKAIAASAALALGGGGLVWANFHASAHESDGRDGRTRSAGAQIATIDCPDVGQQLRRLPRGARSGVDRELANLDEQITEAYARLASTRRAQAGDPGFVQNSVLGPLKSKRGAALDRIGINIRRAGGSVPDGLDRFAECRGIPAEQPGTDEGDGQDQDGGQDGGQDQGGGQDGGQDQGGGRQDDNGNGAAGPVAEDFADITAVEPNVQQPQQGEDASTGTFTTECGVNENDLFNSDNLIVAPGVDNGAHHTHDYVGNQDNDAFSSDDDLANAETSCQNPGDRSTYYWPVLRLQDGSREFDANEPGGGAEGNVGTILKAESAEIRFVGNPRSKVVAMPKFLRIITGDAKAFTNGDANANAGWSCTGFEDRVLADKYPLCPDGSKVVRIFDFQSCWDGQNIDSANHRDHVAFADPATGACPEGFQAIPQLTMNLVYDVPRPSIENGQVRNPFAVDGFPEQLHKPVTDHDDFINVMDEELMNRVVDCINNGEDCR
ncbi:DUF1996 domain-containing protein [Streptomyces sp. DH24]|uniref:DUF1996 domain-containing protein n=1 Tax=Streptomyces sp. DH24 TaxID=3040123 RepID=UPI002442DAD7|nr:DUF1996 domain-containing protein [Streptomyces sp. DH24]MDG9716125.1 DUF1996 domain-containing protein [Streptomyces sp. DH24]